MSEYVESDEEMKENEKGKEEKKELLQVPENHPVAAYRRQLVVPAMARMRNLSEYQLGQFNAFIVYRTEQERLTIKKVEPVLPIA